MKKNYTKFAEYNPARDRFYLCGKEPKINSKDNIINHTPIKSLYGGERIIYVVYSYKLPIKKNILCIDRFLKESNANAFEFIIYHANQLTEIIGKKGFNALCRLIDENIKNGVYNAPSGELTICFFDGSSIKYTSGYDVKTRYLIKEVRKHLKNSKICDIISVGERTKRKPRI